MSVIQGSLVALATPMKADNSLDWHALEKLVLRPVDQMSSLQSILRTGEW